MCTKLRETEKQDTIQYNTIQYNTVLQSPVVNLQHDLMNEGFKLQLYIAPDPTRTSRVSSGCSGKEAA
jgi:hypothetical protein